MKIQARFAFRNLRRSPVRSAALAGVITVGVLVLAVIAAGYQDMFRTTGIASVAADGDLRLVDESDDDGTGMSWATYLEVKSALTESGLVSSVVASSAVDGLLGNGERTAPASGIAVETAIAGETAKPGDSSLEGESGEVPVVLGDALAKTLDLSVGDRFGGLIADGGMTLRLSTVVRTEVLLKDRFFISLPMSALLERDIEPEITAISIWLKDGVSSPGLDSDSGSRGYDEALTLCRSIPALRGFTIFSMPAKNTEVDRIVRIYRSNYIVVLTVVGLTLFLAFLNALSLSVYERQQEFGTLRSMGTPVSQIRSLLLWETLMMAALSWAFGALLSVLTCALINRAGGLVFSAPPGEVSDIRVGTVLTATNLLRVGALVICGAMAAAVISALGLGKTSVVEQLEVRD